MLGSTSRGRRGPSVTSGENLAAKVCTVSWSMPADPGGRGSSASLHINMRVTPLQATIDGCSTGLSVSPEHAKTDLDGREEADFTLANIRRRKCRNAPVFYQQP